MTKESVTTHLCSICENANDASSILKCNRCNTLYHQRCRRRMARHLEDIDEPSTRTGPINYICLKCTYPFEDYNGCCLDALRRIKHHMTKTGIFSDSARKIFTKENKLLKMVYKVNLLEPFKPPTALVGDHDVHSSRIIAGLCASLLQSYSPRATVVDEHSFYRTLSLELYGNENHHTELRLACVLEILNHYRFYDKELTDKEELKRIEPTYFDVIEKACCEWGELPHFYAASAVIGRVIITLVPTLENLENKHRICKLRIVGRAVEDQRNYIVVMWTCETLERDAGLRNHVVLLQALPGVQNPSSVLEPFGDMEITVKTSSENEKAEELPAAEEIIDEGDGTGSAKTSGEWISCEQYALEVTAGINIDIIEKVQCEGEESNNLSDATENMSERNGATPTLETNDLEMTTGSNTKISEETSHATHPTAFDTDENVSSLSSSTKPNSRRVETTETPDVEYQHTMEEVQRCYFLLEMVERELRLDRGRKQAALRDLEEFLAVLSRRYDLNPPSNDSLTAYCTVLWITEEYVRTLALLCAWFNLFASAKSVDAIRKFDTISLYIDYLAVTTEKLTTMGGQNRKIAIEFGLPILENALPKLSDKKINIVEEISVRKIRRIVADIYRMDGRNPPWESEETSYAIQRLLDQLKCPLDEIGCAEKARFISTLMEIQEGSSVDDLVKLSECELYLNRGRSQQTLQDLQDVLRSCTVIGRLSARAKIKDLWNTKHHLKLFIYAYVWCDMFSREELSDDSDYEDTVLTNTLNLELSMRKLFEMGGGEQRMALEYGLPKMTNIIRNFSSSGIASDQVKFLQYRVVIYKMLHFTGYVENLLNMDRNFASPVDDASVTPELPLDALVDDIIQSKDILKGESSVYWQWFKHCVNLIAEHPRLRHAIAAVVLNLNTKP